MPAALTLALLAVVLQTPQTPQSPGVYSMAFALPDQQPMRYAISIPRGYRSGERRPLVLALHPGGPRFPGYGGSFLQQVVAQGLGPLGAIIVAPDCPTQGWTDPVAERAVLALIRSVLADYEIDRSRVLVTGFSLGGRGTWFMASRHPDLFTAAIPIAASPGNGPIERLAPVPTYVIHSRDDEVAAFEPTERAVNELRRLGRTIQYEWLDGLRHYEMGAYVAALRSAGRWVSEQWARRR